MAGIFSLATYGFQNWLAYLNIIMIAASSNAFNLLDLRPGRSQGFAVITLGMLLPFVPLPVALGSILVLLITIIPDARAKVMMGDSGAIAIGTGVALNVVAEKVSLTKLISQNIVLNKIDSLLGRRS
jgi:UDP-N-acetylmuramyl pentapeptide phosphotransferase/UDP-N-acetylglucosamine-1-phosphate transferase